MQEFKKIIISKAEIIPTAERMLADGIQLAMIHGYINSDGKNEIAYEYAVGTGIESYCVVGEDTLPSIAPLYSAAAEWPERELNELMGICFEGLDTSKRLFLPENMLDESGHILVTPLSDLRDKNKKEEEA